MERTQIIKKRYPSTFNYFKDDNVISAYKTAKNIGLINSYDKAIRYNDFVARSIIDKAKESRNIGYVAYFSGQGDEVFDTIDFMGRNDYFGTNSMYDVPLFFLVLLKIERKKQPVF